MIRTLRLELVHATEAHLRAELDGRDAFAAALGAAVPDGWPPELYGEGDGAAARWVLARMAESPQDQRFFQYYFVLPAADAERKLIGVGGFKGPPDDGTVELGYEVIGSHRRSGYATEATVGMLRFAFAHDDVARVTAQTLPHLTASIGVLEKCGFRFVGDGEAEGVIRFEIARDEWQRRQPTGGAFADKLALVDSHWAPKRIARVNDTEVKLARIQGEFVWHRHETEDEMFVVLGGRMLMQFREREEWLGPGEFIVVPRGVEHRPVAPDEVQILLIEPVGTVNTGNVRSGQTIIDVEAI